MEPVFRRAGVLREARIGACRAVPLRARDKARLSSLVIGGQPEDLLAA
jgi:hypothetical protein